MDDLDHPLAMGQLSVWRDIEKFPPERLWEANLAFTWDVPEGTSADDVWRAVGELGRRHESLRTTYFVNSEGEPRQRIAPFDPSATLDPVRQGTADVDDAGAIEEEKLKQAFDVATEMPWRAWILASGGVPRRVLVIAHHLAVDAAALQIMAEDFTGILAGRELPPAGSPRELALLQRGKMSGRIRSAEGYWQRTLSAAPPRLAGEPGEIMGVTLHTGIPVSMVHAAAANLGISAETMLSAAYCYSVLGTTGAHKLLLYSMAHNRLSPSMARVVTSQNQWMPQVVQRDETDLFPAFAQRMHADKFNALKYACYNVDVIYPIRDEMNRQGPGLDRGYHFNAMIAPQGEPGVEVEPHRIEWYPSARATGAAFYMIVRAIASVIIVFRVSRPEFDQPTLATCLASIQDTLSTTVGANALA